MDQVMRKALALQKAMERQVPVKMQAAAVKVFRANFTAQGYVDNGVDPWAARKVMPKMSRPRPSPKILIRSALLINSIRPNGQASWNRISVKAGGPHVPYAQIHNDGGTIRGTFGVRQHERRSPKGKKSNVRQHTRTVNTTIPQRRYMGNSRALGTAMRQEIMKAVAKTMLNK
jgi:phage gpG-like protein